MTKRTDAVKKLVTGILALAIILLAGEFAARLDDWAFQRVPYLAQVDREHDLMLHDSRCVRGRPRGFFKKYRLNDFGFRGPEITREKQNGVKRVVLLGASETFGLYESEGHEFAEILRQELSKSGEPVEIINAAVAGMTLPSLQAYWEHWVSGFGADLVLIYPSPQFYLDNAPPAAVTPHPDVFNRPIPVRSRLLGRFTDAVKQVEWIKRLRVLYVLRHEQSGKDASWIFHEVPADRVDRFRQDLSALAQAVARSGSTPVLVTHAFKSLAPYTEEDLKQLDAFRIFFPRALPEVIPAFDAAAAEATIRVARAGKWSWVDASRPLSGRRDLFADLTHFNDAGSQEMAKLLIGPIRTLLSEQTGKR